MTEVLFWDGPESGIATYKYEEEKEFQNCICCFTSPIPEVRVYSTKKFANQYISKKGDLQQQQIF